MTTGATEPSCPWCGLPSAPIVYGLPSERMFAAAERGEVVLGGCCIDLAMPTHECIAGHRWDDAVPGWPPDFPVDAGGRVAEGLVVWSRSGLIEGRTTGARRRCPAADCPGWLLTVRWETGQLLHLCSQGWTYDRAANEVRVTAGGEISARFVSPAPFGPPPLPREQWPEREELTGRGWRLAPQRG
jgi:hypothetical protein